MPGNELTIQVGAELDLKGLSDQLNSITNKKDNKITFTTNKEINTQLNNLTKSINDISSKDHQINFHIDQRIFNDLQSIVDGLNNGLTQIGEKAAQQAQQMAQQAQQAAEQAAKATANVTKNQIGNIDTSKLGNIDIQGSTKYLNELTQAWEQFGAKFADVEAKVSSVKITDNLDGTQNAIVNFKNALGELTSIRFEGSEGDWTPIGESYRKSFEEAEQAARKFADQMSKFDLEFDKMYSKAFEQKNPLTGDFANNALDALQRYQDKYTEIMQSGGRVTAEQKREIEELGKAAALAIQEQQAAQNAFNSTKKEDYSGLFGQSKEWETALKNITDAENKLNDIQKNAFSGTNALTGDFAKEATRQIEEVKNKFAEIRQAAEQSFDGAASVSKDSLSKMVNDLKADLDRLAKLEYPSDKLAAQNVDVKKAFAADALAEMESRLNSLGDSTTEYYNRVQDLKTLLSSIGQVDSDPSAWANFRNELHMLEDDIKKFKSSTQGMGQKLASGIETGQLQQVVDMVDKLNNIDEKFSGTGVEALQQNLQSLAAEYMNLMEQLQNPDITQDQFNAVAQQVQQLDEQLKQAADAAKIFNDGFKNEADLKKYEQNAEAIRMKFEQLQHQYENLAKSDPGVAAKFNEISQKLEGMDPKNIDEVSRSVNNLAKELGLASGQSAGLRGALQDAFGGFGTYLARFTSSYYIITKTIQGIKSMVNSVKEVDTSLVELQKVTNLTGDSLNSFTEKAYQAGANLGRTGQEVIDATTTFSRAGYDLQEAAQLAQSALVMTNVGVDIPNIESAASDMISILKAFDVQAEESMSVIDKLYNVANKEPLDFGNLTQMLVTAGGTLAQTGTTLEQTMGLLTGAFATMRDTSVANG
jgi:ElaB/YqjD/DUF883 family membrane-anchored ribosome-binding protein